MHPSAGAPGASLSELGGAIEKGGGIRTGGGLLRLTDFWTEYM